jgi:N-acetylated-alpha-linked acidic dipeptidase
MKRALLDAEGLSGRPWNKHLLCAPRPTYKLLVLPGVIEAIEARDAARVSSEVGRLTRALERAATTLEATR